MFETLFVYPLKVYWWNLILLFAVIGVLAIAWWICKNKKLNEKIPHFIWWCCGVLALALALILWAFQHETPGITLLYEPNPKDLLSVKMWGLMLGLGVVAALVLLWGFCKIYKIDDEIYDFYFWNGVVAIAFGLFGAWAFQHIYDAIAGKEFSWGGFTFSGGLVVGAVSFILGTALFAKPRAKSEFYRIANFAAPCIVIAHAFGRFGCFFGGCCYGKESEYGLIFPYGPSNHKQVLPTQLYEAFFLLALFGVMMLLIFVFKKKDFLLILYGVAYAVFRFCIEFIRGDKRGGRPNAVLSPSQWQSIVLLLVIIALSVLVYYFKIIPFQKRTAAVETAGAKPMQVSETTLSDEEVSEPALETVETSDTEINPESAESETVSIESESNADKE